MKWDNIPLARNRFGNKTFLPINIHYLSFLQPGYKPGRKMSYRRIGIIDNIESAKVFFGVCTKNIYRSNQGSQLGYQHKQFISDCLERSIFCANSISKYQPIHKTKRMVGYKKTFPRLGKVFKPFVFNTEI